MRSFESVELTFFTANHAKFPNGPWSPGCTKPFTEYLRKYLCGRTSNPKIIASINGYGFIRETIYNKIKARIERDLARHEEVALPDTSTQRYTITFDLKYVEKITHTNKSGNDRTYYYDAEAQIHQEISFGPGATEADAINAAVTMQMPPCTGRAGSDYKPIIVSVSNLKIVPLANHDLRKSRMKATGLMYKFLDSIKKEGLLSGQCVIDYMYEELEGKHFFKKLLKSDLFAYFGEECRQSGISTDEIIKFAKDKGHITVYALDPFREVVSSYIAPDARVTLSFICNNNHCYGIVKNEFKNLIRSTNKLDLMEFTFNVTDASHIYTELTKVEEIAGLEVPSDKQMVLCELDNLMALAAYITNKTSILVYNYSFSGSNITAFEHPTTKVIYASAPQYKERKYMCDELTRKHGLIDFHFKNQTWTQIGEAMQTFSSGPMMASSYGPQLLEILHNYKIKPVIGRVTDHKVEMANIIGLTSDESVDILDYDFPDLSYGDITIKRATAVEAEGPKTEKVDSYDVYRAHTGVIINNKTPYSIFNHMDEVKDFQGVPASGLLEPGEFYLSRDVTLAGGTIYILSSWYPTVLMNYLISKNVITGADIKYQLIASSHLPADHFKKFGEVCHNDFKDHMGKQPVNCYLGGLNKLESKHSSGCVTNSFEVAMGCVFDERYHGKADVSTKVYDVNGLYFLRRSHAEKVLSGNAPIYRHIIASTYIMLDQLHETLAGSTSTVVAYHTDSLKIINANPIELKAKADLVPGDIRLEICGNPQGTYLKDHEGPPPYVCKKIEAKVIDVAHASGLLCLGMPGSGKTHALKETYKPEDKSICLTFTCKAADELRSRGVHNVMVLDSFFLEKVSSHADILKKALKYDIFNIDEYSMVPPAFFLWFYEIKMKRPETIFRFWGDPNQILPYSKAEDGYWYDYANSYLMKYLTGGSVLTLQYIEGCSRFDVALKDVLDYLQEHRKFPASCSSKVIKPSYINICATNEYRIAGNAREYKRFCLEFSPVVKKVRGREWAVGMPVMCVKNFKSYGLFNGQTYNIVTFDEKYVMLKRQSDGKEVNVNNKIFFSAAFEPNFYSTVNKVQGSTIREPYNIHEIEGMELNNIYTAMSRGIALDMVNFNWPTVKGRPIVFRRPVAPTHSRLRKINTEAIIGRLYYISVEGTDERYYGSTKCELDKRLNEHIDEPTSVKMREFLEMGTPTIHLVREFRILRNATLLAEEAALIRSVILGGIKLRNTVHNPDTVEAVAPKIVQQKEFVKEIKIMDDTKMKRFIVRRIVAGKLIQKTFPYGKRLKSDAEIEAGEYVSSLTGRIIDKSGFTTLPDKCATSGIIVTL